jgi:MFS transporter, OFA family, oxalate/formate antiporter
MFTTHKLTTILFILTAAVLANGAAGLLYTWSLFIIPIEGALGLNRADLGLISSVALVSFTMGVMILPIIVYRIEKLYTAILAFALMAAGHLIFGISSSWISLILGYGLGFGVGSGLAYGFALSLASSLPAGIRALSIGLSLGAFALSGIVLPIVLGNWISTTAPGAAFMRIGIATLFVGVLCSSALVGAAGVVRISDKRALPLSRPISIDKPFLILSLILFLICFAGLAVVSQATAIATAAGITAAGYATTALTVGYLAGSLIGAPFAEQSGERNTLLLLSIFTFLGLLAIITQSQVFLYIGSILTGLTLGGVGSIMPVLLGILKASKRSNATSIAYIQC